MTQEIVINVCFGGFGVSVDAVEWMREIGYPCGDTFVLPNEEYSDGSVNDNISEYVGNTWNVDRDAEGLVECVKAIGSDANGRHAKLRVVEIPDGVEWEIDEYDGTEKVVEPSRVWR